jgi:hypothetical protein
MPMNPIGFHGFVFAAWVFSGDQHALPHPTCYGKLCYIQLQLYPPSLYVYKSKQSVVDLYQLLRIAKLTGDGIGRSQSLALAETPAPLPARPSGSFGTPPAGS